MSRKYFGTDGVRGKVGKNPITIEFAQKLGWAAGKVLCKADQKNTVVLGKDSRQSGDMLEAALVSGLNAAGVDAVCLGILPTPGIAHYVKANQASAGIVISASHNPFYDNGIKFFSSAGEKLPDDVELSIESYIDKDLEIVSPENIGQIYTDVAAAEAYAEFCLSIVDTSVINQHIKVVIDCANGATSSVAPSLFTKLGLDVIFINHQPSGININLNAGAVHLASLQETVVKEQADIGFAYDGDGDRVMAVNSAGQVVDGDEILFILANDYQQKNKLDGMVGTLMTNFGIEQNFKQKAIPFVRAKVGDRYVMELLKKNNWLLGGESSGHIICLDANSTGDGIIASLKILEILSRTNKKVSDLLQGVSKTPQIMINVPLKEKITSMDLDRLAPYVEEVENKLGQKGRVLLRPSGTEPVLRVMVEAVDGKEADQYVKELVKIVKETLV